MKENKNCHLSIKTALKTFSYIRCKWRREKVTETGDCVCKTFWNNKICNLSWWKNLKSGEQRHCVKFMIFISPRQYTRLFHTLLLIPVIKSLYNWVIIGTFYLILYGLFLILLMAGIMWIFNIAPSNFQLLFLEILMLDGVILFKWLILY